ncbi:hypothetical protein E6R60_14890 [Streptomyces sp. A0642]|uniref:Bax inhibitor-1/YccA family membrane protein n=1 Tax=Streptomyces sp. A0642 TaxID=2563100 RepID=UPI0010A2783D|nr:Bax inhibitor-1/YccA family protein [Streptomyces sp. A0642]THA76046.1 hypothetical protein E6R60_14890 [Streptomyces sp. A0642]
MTSSTRRSGAALLGLGLLALADWMLWQLAGADGLGLHPRRPGSCLGVLGAVLGSSVPPTYFRQIEDGIARGASRDQCWLVAFGLVLTPVWLYVEAGRLCTLYPADERC